MAGMCIFPGHEFIFSIFRGKFGKVYLIEPDTSRTQMKMDIWKKGKIRIEKFLLFVKHK
jgi:hypothetical protein